jgi:fatty acid desaturase
MSTLERPARVGTDLAALRRATLRPRDGAANVGRVLLAHATLLAWLWLGYWYLPAAVYIPCSLFVCVVHQRAMSEWIHEGAHRNIVANARANDAFGNALAGVWFMLPVDVYRASHFAHHRAAGFFTTDDPETTFLEVQSRRSFKRALVEDLTGITMVRQYRRFRANQTTTRGAFALRLCFAVVLLGVAALAFLIGRVDAVVLYYGTLVTLYPMLNRLRTYGQHVVLEPSAPPVLAGSTVSRTIDAGWWDRLVWTSPRLLYHFEHHRHPFLPWRALSSICERADDANVYTRSRLGVLRGMYAGLPEREPVT